LRQRRQHDFQARGDRHGGFSLVIRLFDLGIAVSPEFLAELESRTCMALVDKRL
jgi:hypothetical protein